MNENNHDDEDSFASLLRSAEPMPAANVAETFYRAGWEAACESRVCQVSVMPAKKGGYPFSKGLVSGLAASLVAVMLAQSFGFKQYWPTVTMNSPSGDTGTDVRPFAPDQTNETQNKLTPATHNEGLPLFVLRNMQPGMTRLTTAQASLSWLNGMDLDGTDSRVSREAIRYSQPSPTVPPEIEVENENVPETIPLKTPRGLKLQEEVLRLFQKV